MRYSYEELQALVDELDLTADGVPITPKTKLYQHDGWGNMSSPWKVGAGWEFRRLSSLNVYSTPEAAIVAYDNGTHRKKD